MLHVLYKENNILMSNDMTQLMSSQETPPALYLIIKIVQFLNSILQNWENILDVNINQKA